MEGVTVQSDLAAEHKAWEIPRPNPLPPGDVGKPFKKRAEPPLVQILPTSNKR